MPAACAPWTLATPALGSGVEQSRDSHQRQASLRAATTPGKRKKNLSYDSWSSLYRQRGPAGQLFLQHKMAAPVLLPALLVGFGAERLLLAITDGIDATAVDAALSQSLFDSGGAFIAERQIVFRGAALVAVAFDHKSQVGMLLQKLRCLRQRSLRIRAQVIAVIFEEHILHVAGKHLLFSFRDWRWRRRSNRDSRRGLLRAAGTFRGQPVGG